MGQIARSMFRKSLEALMSRDEEKAIQVMAEDDEVDTGYYNVIEMVKEEIGRGHNQAEELIGWILVAKHIERVADLATNIAEDTIYMVTGDIVRHGQE